mmetsp:Transcript_29743/g.86179  ORF Transcript_29743/g.86179 Transcript_29743/m.86179 type:complete len:393 (+) Transcript_29743:119-1297(+)
MSGKPIDYSRWDNLDLSDSSDDEGPTAGVSRAMAAMAVDKQKKQQQQQPEVTASSDVPFTSAEMPGHKVPLSQQKEANQPGSTAASSSAASPRVAGATDGDTMPFNYDEMPGYKVHRSPSAAYPSPKRCGMCGKSPPAVLSLSDCNGCHLISYCGKECQIQHWRAKHKKVCQATAGLPPYRRAHVTRIKYIGGMMDDDEFYELQRRREDQIISEVASHPVEKVLLAFKVDLLNGTYLDIVLVWSVDDEECHPSTAVEGAMAYPSRQGRPALIICPSFRLARLSMEDTTRFKDLSGLSTESARSLYASVVSVVSKAIEDVIYKIVAKTNGRVPPPILPFIKTDSFLEPLFWANKAASITIRGSSTSSPAFCRPALRPSSVRAGGSSVRASSAE